MTLSPILGALTIALGALIVNALVILSVFCATSDLIRPLKYAIRSVVTALFVIADISLIALFLEL